MTKRINFSRILIIGLFTLSACIPTKSTIFQDNSCSPPCWENITPGVTTNSELELLLQEKIFLPPAQIYHDDYYDGFRNYYYGMLSTQEEIVIALLQNTASFIYFSGLKDRRGLGITFGDAIRLFGEPEFIIVSQCAGIQKFLGIVRGPFEFICISAISPQKGVWFSSGYPLPDQYELSDLNIIFRADSEISEIAFFDPDQFEKLANKGRFSHLNFNSQQLRERLYPWAGYGDLDTKYPFIP